MVTPARIERSAHPLLRSCATAFLHHRCRRRRFVRGLDLLKIDVDGYGMKALRGATETLRRLRDRAGMTGRADRHGVFRATGA